MLNIPTTDILTPIKGEVEKPIMTDHSETAEISFQSVIAAEDIDTDALIPVSNLPLVPQTHLNSKADLVSLAAAFPAFITLPETVPETVPEPEPDTAVKTTPDTMPDPVLPPQGDRLDTPLIMLAAETDGGRGDARSIVSATPAYTTESRRNEQGAIPIAVVSDQITITNGTTDVPVTGKEGAANELRPAETELPLFGGALTGRPPKDMPVLAHINIAGPTKEETADSAAPVKRNRPTAVSANTILANDALPKLPVNSSEGLLSLVDLSKAREISPEKTQIIQQTLNAAQTQSRPIESPNGWLQQPATEFVGDGAMAPKFVPVPFQGSAPSPIQMPSVDQPDLARPSTTQLPQNPSEGTTRPEMLLKEVQIPVQGPRSQENQLQLQPAMAAPVQPVQPLVTQLPPIGIAPQAASSPIAERHSAKLNSQPTPVPQARASSSSNSTKTASSFDMGPTLPMTETITTEALEPLSTPELMPFEAKSADSTSLLRHDVNMNRPEVMRHVAQQLVEVARQMPDRPVELALNPEELGRVRLTFTTTEGGIHVAVMAERGETMDLLRRHIETLAQEFREMGYKDVNFEFSRNGQNEAQNGETDAQSSADQDTASGTPQTQDLAPIQLSLEPSAGLDLRL